MNNKQNKYISLVLTIVTTFINVCSALITIFGIIVAYLFNWNIITLHLITIAAMNACIITTIWILFGKQKYLWVNFLAILSMISTTYIFYNVNSILIISNKLNDLFFHL